LENQQLRVREQALRNEREQNQDYRDSLEKDLEGLTKKVAEGAAQVNSLHQILVAKKEELHQAVDIIKGNSTKLDGLKQEITRLKGEIVTNPEELIQVNVIFR
jgi:chromosome segregation ATPase